MRYGTQQTERSIGTMQTRTETRVAALETTVAGLETKIDNLTKMLQAFLDQQQS